jgi:ATP synthase F1 delta subunit
MNIANFQTASVYAKALITLNLPNEALERVISEILTIANYNNVNLKIIEGIPLSIETKNFLKVVINQKKTKLLASIAHLLKIKFLEKNNITLVKVVSAKELSHQEEGDLTQQLKAQFKSEIMLEKEVDKTLISGFKLHFGAYLIDFSKKAKISKIKTCILK